MHFKASLIAFALVLSTAAQATGDLESYWSNNLDVHYRKLNERVEYCKSLQKSFEYSNSIDNRWFNSLTLDEKRTAIAFAFQYSSEKCFKQERSTYADVMLRYVAVTGNEEPYKEWMRLFSSVDSYKKAAESLDIDELISFSNNEFERPFDGIKMLKALGLY